MHLRLYTDATVLRSRKAICGWAFVATVNDTFVVARAGSLHLMRSTAAELLAARRAMMFALGLRRRADFSQARVELISDCQYALSIAEGSYLPKKDRQDALDVRALSVAVPIDSYTWVRAHSGQYWNEYCDHLARAVARQAVARREPPDRTHWSGYTNSGTVFRMGDREVVEGNSVAPHEPSPRLSLRVRRRAQTV